MPFVLLNISDISSYGFDQHWHLASGNPRSFHTTVPNLSSHRPSVRA